MALILAGASDLTRGQDIAISQFYPPHMYLVYSWSVCRVSSSSGWPR